MSHPLDEVLQALEFYANVDNYEDQDNSCSDPDCCGGPSPYFPILQEEGEKAKKALSILTAALANQATPDAINEDVAAAQINPHPTGITIMSIPKELKDALDNYHSNALKTTKGEG